jgi:hypothetical protein
MLDLLINPLFYWTLAHASCTSNHITAHTATGSHSRSVVPPFTTCTGHSPAPSILTSGTANRRSSAPSVLTGNVGIVSNGIIGLAKAKAEPAPDHNAEMVTVNSDGGPSDRDETNSNLKERLAAVNSPLKGRKRVSREVSLRLVIPLLLYHLYHKPSIS